MNPVAKPTSRKTIPTQDLLAYISICWRELEFVNENEQTNEIVEAAIITNWRALKFVKNPTDDHIRLALSRDGAALQYVKRSRQTEEFCLNAIRKGTLTKFKLFKNSKFKTHAVCLAAVKHNPYDYKDCPIKTDDIKVAAVQKNYRVLADIDDHTEELCLLALKQNYKAILYFNRKFSQEFYQQCIDLNPDSLRCISKSSLNYDLALYAVKSNWKNLNYFSENSNFLTEELCVTAYQQDIRALQFLWAHIAFPLKNDSQRVHITSKGYIIAPDMHVVDLDNNSPELLALLSFDRERQIACSLESEKMKLGNPITPNRSTKRMGVL